MKITREHKTEFLIADLLQGFSTLMTKASQEYAVLRKTTENGKSLLCNNLATSFYMQWSSENEDDSEVVTDKDRLFLESYSKFLAQACILAYLGLLDNDKNWDKVKKEKHDNLVNAILKEKGKDYDLTDEDNANIANEIEQDFNFGYSGLSMLVQSCVECLENSESNANTVKEKVESNLLSNERSITYQEYLSGGFIDKDVALIAEMGNKDKRELVDVIVTAIKEESQYNTYIDAVKSGISAVYKYLFQDSFGLRPYEGVVTFAKPYTETINYFDRSETIKGAKATFNPIVKKLKSFYDVIESKSRQFDIDAILSNKGEKPMYFPLKILEYAKGRELTYNLTENLYRRHSRSATWDDYYNNYVSEQLDEYILYTIYRTLELNITEEDLKDNLPNYVFYDEDKDKPFSFTSKSFQSYVKLGSSDYSFQENLSELITEEHLGSKILANLEKLQKSLCSAVVITSYSSLGGTLVKLAIRIVDTCHKLNIKNTRDLFSDVVVSSSTVDFQDGIDITDGKTLLSGYDLPFKIYEYKHDFNPTLSDKEPMFAYTAVEKFLEQGISIDWEHLLIGEDLSGTPLFASKEGKDDINMQKNVVHNIVAGSRSGKGLLTMTLLASAVASKKAVFYLDRKPDMAILLQDLSQGNMFVANGAAFSDDNKHLFKETGAGIKGWEIGYDNAPDYVKENLFQNKRAYYGNNFGDMVYLRAMILMLGVVYTKNEAQRKNKVDIYESLGGDTTELFLVIDEFTNWLGNFGCLFKTSGTIAQKAILEKNTKEDNFHTLKQKIEDIRLQLGDLDPEKDKMKIRKFQRDLDSKTDELNHLVSPFDLYCTCLMNSVIDTHKYMRNAKNADFKDTKVYNATDIFVISQELELPKSDDHFYAYKNGGKNEFYIDPVYGADSTPFRSWFLLDIADIDFFIGRLAAKYISLENDTKIVDLLDRSRWIYLNANYSALKDEATVRQNMKMFKPFLVLNKNREDDPTDPAKHRETVDGSEIVMDDKDFEYVSQCRSRCTLKLWNQIRLKHLGNRRIDPDGTERMVEDAMNAMKGDKSASMHYDELNPGIGFQGLTSLITETQRSKDSYAPFNPATDFAASKKFADFIAQKLGYTDYKEYLFDMTPQGIFSVSDIVKICLGESKADDYKTRLKPYYTFGYMSEDTDAKPEKVSDTKAFDNSGEIAKMNALLRQQEEATKKSTDVISEPISEPILKQASQDEILTDDVKEAMERSNADDGLNVQVVALNTTNTASQNGILTDDVKESMERSNTEDTKLYLTKNDLIATYMFDLMEQIESVTLEQKGPMPVAFYRQILNTMKEKDSFIDALLDCARDENPDVEVILND